ncbi:hypothetical protein EDI_268730 [Entamoeba dispar SAW760]|uniref:Uncharacterized protein n=1 Tax=Entamoeba dispar (strain ATCC PRA-260 / SAW760) TaxID=370354 RepID=B0ES00_ENTDS|nr:uncharacterized protein EDI_268730 [Entamoeba dispar SAW760]EDR22696.1 hypothetical protein EDI_268730 [Entamoeba dispar SAW760]|eukprot:EDR22696.1 hypothetical protein EDI_268730 [Entamoeba dispar SAW760]
MVPKVVELNSEYATNCKNCNKTCHYPCHVPFFISALTMRGCSCIVNGRCTVCGCSCSEHVNSTYRHDFITETKEQTVEEIFERYNEGKKGIASAENVLKRLEDEYYEIQMDCYEKQEKIKECVNILSSITLNGNSLNDKVNSSNEYLDLLIKKEIEEKKHGYTKRIKGYEKLKQANEIIDYIIKKSPSKKSKEEIKAEFERRMKELE